MRKILVALFLMVFCLCNLTLSAIPFKNIDLNRAIVLAQKEQKLIFISFSAKWCSPCKLMQTGTFANTEVTKVLSENFININAEVNTKRGGDWKNYYGVSKLPTMIIADNRGKELFRIEGSLGSKALIERLNSWLDIKVTPTALIENKTGDWILKASSKLNSPSEAKTYAIEATHDNPTKQLINNSYELQVGAFSVLKNADNRIRALQNDGIYTARILIENRNNGPLYLIIVDQYADYNSVRQNLTALRQKGYKAFLRSN